MITRYCLPISFKLDVFVEVGAAAGAFGQEVEADAVDVAADVEVGGVVDLVALYFELHQSPVVQPYLVALAQVFVDDFRQADHGGGQCTDGDAVTGGYLVEYLVPFFL